jgi:hypothetical protein
MNPGNRPRVFFACDTGSPAYSGLRNGLDTIVGELGLDLLVFDREIDPAGAILEKVERQISSGLCVLADVGCDPSRPSNANVMLEVGIARGMSRPALLLLNEPSKAPTNLHGRDFVRFPSCLQVGTPDHNVLTGFLRDLGKGLLGGRNMRLFSSRSPEYMEVLKNIEQLPGREWYVGPELRSFMRPQDAETRWLREYRKVSPARIHAEADLRAARRKAFEVNLLSHLCVDVYPRSAFDLRSWRGMTLTPAERRGFLTAALESLRSRPTYEMALVDSDSRQKYWIKETRIGGFVVFEGWGHIDITSDKATGGLVMTDPEVVASFRAETEKMVEHSGVARDDVIRFLEGLIADDGTSR